MDLEFYDENKYLISMTQADKIIEAGTVLGLNDKCSVLDLCCGYGEMLKLWAENFNIKGVGVDRCTEYINTGNRHLHDAQLNNNITLIAEEVQTYITDEKFDIACLCGVGDLFGGIDGHISMLERFIKPTGKLVIAECFLNKESAPKELREFEGELYTLYELYRLFSERGWYVSWLSTGTNADWERYISWEARRTIEKIRKSPDDKRMLEWLDKWYHMYFKYRREYEGWGFFVLERIW